jgi:antibiotic biosynthesis monooxygenase (ABM) superfamily enzyme
VALPGRRAAGKLPGVAAIEKPEASEAPARSGERAARTDPVTAVFSRRVKPGREAEFEDWAHAVIEAATRYPGHLGASVLHEPGSPYYHVVYKFTDRDRFRAWVESDERRRFLAEAERLTEEDHDLQQTTGLETWFDLPGPEGAPQRPPPRWKMWLVSLLAVYPLVLLFQWLLAPRVEGWPLPLRALAFPLVLLTLMTYVVMPVVTRLLRRLLRRSPEAW